MKEKPIQRLKRISDKTDKSPVVTPAEVPVLNDGDLPRLSLHLERLVRAASSNVLPAGSMLESGLVIDLNRHTLAWAASYLTSDRDEALIRLWQAYRVWQG